MSGAKQRRLTPQQELRRDIDNNMRRMNDLAYDIGTAMRNQNRQLRNELDSHVENINRRFSQQDRDINNLSSDIRNIERRTNEQFRQQRNYIDQGNNRISSKIDQNARRMEQGFNDINNQLFNQRREYRNLINDTKNEFNNRLNDQRREYINLIDDTRNEMESQRKYFQSKIENIHKHLNDTLESQKQHAENIRQAAEYVINDIINNYKPDKFKPRAIQTLQEEFNHSSRLMATSTYQAAIASYERIYLEGRRLREELHLLSLEWETNLNIAKQKAIEALSVHEAHSNTKFSVDTEEGEIEVEGNVDYWTNGSFNKLKEEVETYKNHLDNPDDLSKEELINITTELEKRIHAMHILASMSKENLISSQMKATIADDILCGLEDAAWSFSDSTYSGEDMRGQYHMKLENAAGDEIVVVVSSDRDEDGKMQYKLETDYFFENPMSESSRMAIENDITALLSDIGYNTNDHRCRPGTENANSGDTKRLDFDRVRSENPDIKAINM